MAYFVTGATGFIGRFFVAHLIKRGKPVYVLVRKSSAKKLAALREHWGVDDKQVVAIQPLSVLIVVSPVLGFYHLTEGCISIYVPKCAEACQVGSSNFSYNT